MCGNHEWCPMSGEHEYHLTRAEVERDGLRMANAQLQSKVARLEAEVDRLTAENDRLRTGQVVDRKVYWDELARQRARREEVESDG